MSDWTNMYNEKLQSAETAVQTIKSGDRIFIGTASSIAYKLADALYERKEELEDVVIGLGLTTRKHPFFMPEAKGHFSTVSYFAGPGERVGIKNGQTAFTSLHLSQIRDWARYVCRPNVAFFEVSPPDENGYMSYGAFGVVIHNYIKELADTIILQVNKNVPYVYGSESRIHVSEANIIVEADDQIAEIPSLPFDDTVKKLSEYIIEQIPDGACMQLGLGGLSDAVGYGLRDKNDLGIHTEMLTNSMMDLIKAGNVTNKYKNYMPGKTLTGFALGTRELYDFVDHNEDIYFAPFYESNNPYIIAQNDNVISVNTAMSIDLYGQVVADCLAGKQQSGTGGQVDYVRGAQMSKGGKSFIALTSAFTDRSGKLTSRIVPAFAPGTAVTTTRSDVQYVVTEHGCVNLGILTMEERTKALISLAHPDFRGQLADQAKELGLLQK